MVLFFIVGCGFNKSKNEFNNSNEKLVNENKKNAKKKSDEIVVDPIEEDVGSIEIDLGLVPSCRTPFNKNEHKRRAAPDDFLISLYSFINNNCKYSVLFDDNDEPRDVFKYLANELGLQKNSSLEYRCAAMFELLRVSAAMESSYNWKEGRDKSASNYAPDTMEAGIFQTSANSHVYAHKGYWGRWEYLDQLTLQNNVEPQNFYAWRNLQIDASRKNYIFEHHAFLIRHNFHHYGPMIDKRRVGQNISKKCIEEVANLL